MPSYDRAPAQRFNFKGMSTVLPPDAMPPGKYPMAINARAYFEDAVTARLPQTVNQLSGVLPNLIHSLRRMDDTTPAPVVITSNGPNPCTSGVNNPPDLPGQQLWANPGNVILNDGNFATVTVTAPPTSSRTLFASGFGFALPVGFLVTGILCEIKGFSSPAGQRLAVPIFKAGVFAGFPVGGGVTLPGVSSFVSAGSNLDLWGNTWTAADINDPAFGVGFTGTVSSPGPISFSIDFVRLTVYGYVPSGAVAGFVLISAETDKVYVDATLVQSGMSGKRLAMVPFRPNTSVAPWMYVGDSNKLIKIRSDMITYKQGIMEPQTIPVTVLAGAGPITGNIFYACKYRSSATGAQSNPSPVAHNKFIVAAANAIQVTCPASTDPQADLIDVYRFGDVLDYTYVSTVQNGTPNFIDSLSAAAIANNPLMQFDDFEPFPSIDVPKTSVVTVGASGIPGTILLTRTGGDFFNLRWLGGTTAQISLAGAVQGSGLILFARPLTNATMIVQVQPVGTVIAAVAGYTLVITQPILAAQPLPAFWGPTDNAAFMFACGDPLRPGTLYFTKGNNPDSAPDTNTIEITSPAEPLIGGCIVGGLSLVMSGERGWLIYPNFAQATATIVGVQGSPFSTVESIADRGLFTKEGICADGGGNAYFIAKDSIRKSPGGVGSVSITDDIYNLFPHEGASQQIYNIAGYIIQPPNYTQPDGMALRFSQGYVYFDYIGLDNNRYTLNYDTDHEAWSVDTYVSPASIHADNPGSFISPGPNVPLGPLMGCLDGTVRKLSPTGTEAGAAAAMTILTPAWDAGEQRADKHFGDLYLETTTPAGVANNFTLALFSDRYSVFQAAALTPATIPAVAGLRVGSVLELNAGSGVYGRDIELAIQVAVNNVGSLLHLWQPSSILQPETTGERFSDWYDAENNGTKFVQGVIVEADTGNVPKQFAVQSADDLSVTSFVEVGAGIAFNGRSKKAFSVAVPVIAHSIRLVPQDTVPWRVWDLEWIWVPYPELARVWATEVLSHGLKGFQHLGDMNVAHLSTADVTLTLNPDNGTPIVITIPNSGGLQTKSLVTIPAIKFKLLGYLFSSTQPFRLWKDEIEVEVKQWGDSGPYQIVKPFGGSHSEGAVV